MLKSVSIEKLYGHYDYAFDVDKDSSWNGLLFLTGPNGMGKTTLLKLIYALYRYELELFVKTPFENAEFAFDNGNVIKFEQRVDYPANDDTTDVPAEGVVNLDFSFNSSVNGEGESHSLKFVDGEMKIQKNGGSMMEQFLTTDACLFISDDRIFSKDFHGAYGNATADPKILKTFLKKLQKKLDANSDLNKIGIPKSKGSLQSRIEKIREVLEHLKELSISSPIPEDRLSNQIGEELEITVCRYEHSFQACKAELELIETFRKAIDDACFVDKKIKMSPEYGYRFKTDYGVGLLNWQQLSSGEKHFFCMMYSLCFVVGNNSFVMIDEPELSFHMMWQMAFCKQIKALVKNRKLKMLIATHSPQMFDGDFSLTYDLYRVNKEHFKKLSDDR